MKPWKKNEMESFYRSGDNPWKMGEGMFRAYRRIFEKIGGILPEFLRILELGCGEGYFAEEFFKHFGNRIDSFLGIDISRTAIVVANKKLALYKNVKLIQSDFEINWKADFVKDINFVIANEVLYYCNKAKDVYTLLDRDMVLGSYLLVADSLGTSIVREEAHRWFNFDLIKKIRCVDYEADRPLVAFLTRKR